VLAHFALILDRADVGLEAAVFKRDAKIVIRFKKSLLGVFTFLLVSINSTNTVAMNSDDLGFLSPVLFLLLDDDSIGDPVETDVEAIDFLISASFGPTDDSVKELRELGYSDWFKRQASLPILSLQAETNQRQISDDNPEDDQACLLHERFSREAWFKFAITGEDQLRQRVAFALSQLFVVATHENFIKCKTLMQGNYMDMLQGGAFGNFRRPG